MEKEDIFIHIPKTGGTTINTAMHNTYWQTEVDFHYRHIQNKTKKSNSADIFDPGNFEKYRQYNIFMMLRDPVDRMISEYHFLRERQEFMSLLRPRPNSFEDFVKNSQTHNYVINFLLGRRIYGREKASDADLKKVINAIEQLPIHVGIFEFYPESMGYFQEVTNVQWPKKLEVKRMTFKRPSKEQVSDELKALIVKNNQLEQQLYEHCLEHFLKIKNQYSGFKVNFIKNKYNHVIPYAAKTCLFEFCMDNKNYIKNNFKFFKDLNFYLLKDLQIKKGSEFVRYWNGTFVNSIRHHFPDTPFQQIITEAYDQEEEPLEQTIRIGAAADRFFKEEGKKANKYYKAMAFDPSLVKEGKGKSGKPGLLKRLFGKK